MLWKLFYSWSYTKYLGVLTFATSRYTVTFYLKMLVFICRGGEVDMNLLRKEWGYFLLECTLNDSFSPSFVSDISAVFSVKLNPVRLKSKQRENWGFMRTIYIYFFPVLLSSFHLLLIWAIFLFLFLFFPVNITYKEDGNRVRTGLFVSI